tara:strand:+ start:134 stop:700 length:567 start_codon:yes stop_codon:yes gene_type:complete
MLLNFFKNSAAVLESLDRLEETCVKIAEEIKDVHKKGNSILLAGNGGSCSDSLHFAGELSCTYSKDDRKPFRAICLQANQSALTAWSNDFDFTSFYQRQIEAIGRKGDLLVLFSTSGGCLKTKRSLNLILAANEAKKRGIKVVGFVGKSGGELVTIVDIILHVQSNNTAMVQQGHITLVHAICELLEH